MSYRIIRVHEKNGDDGEKNNTAVKSAGSITVQHGSADTVVRAMNVKYRKWRLGVL